MTDGTGHPVAVGGIGGSGTRVIAALLGILGYHLGDDLNEAMDNLWFTLLFKRRSILVDTEAEFAALASLFISRMSGATAISEEDRARIFRLAQGQRLQHSRDWLIERATAFCNGRTSKRAGQPWAWKEPNTHLVIERIWAFRPDVRYIHVVRHPLDMALSANRNQLQNWGPIFLNVDDVPLDARSSLSYWCRAHRRIAALMASRSGHALMVDFDALCVGPDAHGVQIAGFLGTDFPDEALARFCTLVHRPDSTGRFAGTDLQQFDPDDLEYVTELGYRF